MSFALALLGTCLLWQLCWIPARFAVSAWVLSFDDLERVCLSFLAAAFLLYAACLVGLVLGLPVEGRWWLAGSTFGLLILWQMFVSRRQPRFALRPSDGELRWALLTTAVPVWVLVLAWTQSNICGGGWTGDWHEHYRRTLFFLGRIPIGEFLEFGVTDRPPLFNIVASGLAAIVGSTFYAYQIIHLVLSSLASIPAFLILRRLTGGASTGSRAFALFLFVWVLHPMVMANTLYTWTRMLTAFFVLTAIHFYLRYHRDGKDVALTWSLLASGCAIATHYSAAPPMALMGAHLVWAERKKARSVASLLRSLVALLFPAGLWLFWAVRDFGWRATLSSNTTAQNYAQYGVGGVVLQWRYNLLTTLVPFWDTAHARPYFQQVSTLGACYDALHLYWVSTLPGSISTALVVTCLVLWLKGAHVSSSQVFPAADCRWLVVFSLAVFVFSFPTIPNLEVSGIAHLVFQPFSILLCIVGLAWIITLGVGAQRLLLVLYGAEGLVFLYLKTFDRSLMSPGKLGFGYLVNLQIKESHHLTLLFDLAPAAAAWARGMLLFAVVCLWVWCSMKPVREA